MAGYHSGNQKCFLVYAGVSDNELDILISSVFVHLSLFIEMSDLEQCIKVSKTELCSDDQALET